LLQIVVGVSLLLVIAFVGYRRTFISFRLPDGVRILYLTGTEFLLVGVALGEGLIGLLDEPTIGGLSPLLSLGLGFIGLLFGMQFEIPQFARFPRSYLGVALVQAGVTMAAVFFPFFAGFHYFGAGEGFARLEAALFLAASAACTAPATLALMRGSGSYTGL